MSDSTEPNPPPQATNKPNALAPLLQPNNVISALKWGGLIALLYYAVSIPLVWLSNVMLQAGTGLFATVPACLQIFAFGFALYAAAYWSAHERGSIIVGMAGAIVMLVVAEILSAIYHPAVNTGSVKGSSGTTTPAIFIVSALLYLIVTLLIGWAGASIGTKNYARRAAATTPRR
jgi:hypothetical protein